MTAAYTQTFEAIGTRWHIDVFDPISAALWDETLRSIHEKIAKFDKNYSRFRSDSFVSEVARSAGSYPLPSDLFPMLSLYDQLYKLTGGAMTPLVGQVLSDAGYDAHYSLVSKPLVSPPLWDDVIEYDEKDLTIKRPALLDFGAVGKGYLVDIVAGILRRAGVTSFTVNAGGDIVYEDNRLADPLTKNGYPLLVGLENPNDPNEVIGVAEIQNQSICGSSGNRRAWGEYHHIIDPRSLASPRHILALWTIAETTMLADALSTALFFTDADTLRTRYSFEYLILFPDYSIARSPGFVADLFTH